MATKSETERALAEIRKCVEHAGEILARDHHRPELGGGGWAFDFGALEYTVGSIRDVLDKLDEATRSASGDGRVVKS